MRIDDHRLRADNNNLTLVRLVLASAVIWTHSYWLVTGIDGADEFAAILGAPISVFAVDGFFFLSGFLVYRSLLRRNSVVDFAKARLARLWPALAVSVLATTAIGALFTQVPLADYPFGPTARFVLGNLSLVLPGYVLTGVPCIAESCAVNGSLWTIPWEVRCYFLLGVLAIFGLASERFMHWLILPGSLVAAMLWQIPAVSQAVTSIHPGLAYNLAMVDRLWSMFALGIAAHLFRDRIALSWPVLAVLAVASALALHAKMPMHIDSLFTGYAVLCFGFLTARGGSLSGKWPDYSYGMYIYAFPVMIALQAALGFSHHAGLAAANLIATLPLAALSWHFVEKPVLDLVGRSRKQVDAVESVDKVPLRQSVDRS